MAPANITPQKEKILFPLLGAALIALMIPPIMPLMGMLMLGNFMRESGVVRRLSETAQGALIEDTYYRSFLLSFPHLVYKDVDLPMERGALRHPLEFACLATESAPSGMSGILDPFQVDVVNTRSTDVLG